jgi:hypothetical protein
MTSVLNGVNIIVEHHGDWISVPIYGTLQVLDKKSTNRHYAGAVSSRNKITGWLLDPTDFNALRDAYKNGSTITYTNYWGISYSVKIIAFDYEDVPAINYPLYYVYKFTMELEEQ